MDTGPKRRRQTNPRYKANLFSVLTFGWTLETFMLGYSRDIKEDDLYAPLPEHRSDMLGDAMQTAWEQEVENTGFQGEERKPSLMKVLCKVFGFELVLYGLILAAMEFLIRLQQPLFLGLLLRYYSPAQDFYNNTATSNTYFSRLFKYYDVSSGITWGEAVFFSFGLIFCSMANVMIQHPFMMGVMHLGMKMRVGVCSLIYRKALKVNLQAMSENRGGLVVNLMANDVNRFDSGPLFIHYLWIGPIETLLMTAYLYREMGISAVYGALMIVAAVPFQIFLGTRTSHYRRKTALKSDERVRLMEEIVMGIEVIKMYTWEKPFRKIIDTVRRQEVHYIKMTSYIRGMVMSFIMFTARFSIFITVLLYVVYVNRITVENVFFLTCYYNILKQTMTLFFPQAVGQIAEMNVAVQRINDFLLSEECRLPSRTQSSELPLPHNKPKKRVTIPLNPVRPPKRRSPRTEPNTSTIKSQDKPKELRKDQIAIKFDEACSRWIKSSAKDDVKDITLSIYGGSLTTIIGAVGSGSVRQNILFGQPFVKSRYMEVCKVCALERDISLFPHGDKTIVGERGVSLSGGQRARINLARAVYKEADIYLLDDPLSAVDTQVARHIFENCIKGYLESKTVILVTHQLQFIKSVDQIVIVEKGKIIADGDYNDLTKQELPIIQLMQDKSHEMRKEDNSSPNKFLQGTSNLSIKRSHWSHWSIMFDTIDQKREEEAQIVGRVKGSVYKEYFSADSAYIFVALVFCMFVLAQFFASASDYWISRWSNAEDHLTGDKTMDNLLWSQHGLRRKDFALIFGVLTIATIVVALIRAFLFFSLCMKSSIKLHDNMFERISLSPMSFFHANPSGRILNRFSKDMGSVDELLPQAMLDCFQIMLNLVGVLIVILMTEMALLIPIAAALIIFYIFRLIYVRTTSAIKRLEGITRSPVFGHVNATIQGLPTIRSFGAEQLLVLEFDRHQDLHSAAWYLFITCSRAFGYFLDVICLLFIMCVTFSCLMKTGIEGSKVGLIITQSISLTGIFQWGMRQSAEMENQMTSVERVLEYTKLPQEVTPDTPDQKPPEDWPTDGAIQFEHLSLRYSPSGDHVLNDLQFNILPQEKIGIVGRTGAGKSSIIQALFRLAYLDGTINIDGIDITSIGINYLRQKISIIPQEPVLFSGSLRKNLDPFDEYPDVLLLRALDKVKLLSEDENVEALYKQVSDCGSNFSVGERQLVCLARAIVNNDKILLLDEATANVDAQTDALIQTAIKEHFRSCTVLTVAHRLNTVIDSDKILVLDAGYLVEFDHPHLLLQNRKGYFRKMVAETGPAMSQLLHKLAADVRDCILAIKAT
ncbi:probable multidrug resistance-associated protein lethal(2)03659 isoform X2 [Pararge aegeria]|uniref:probable multidrug resistance-associated protein lethal(2)03659 isoform X2 n=1 Tax=Pararge aegeria TaxID=116150 RepID=UPI0019D06887|nr:probable multidrug resistance-associated protein lethal(2)03659 isoform X2 [Pararge aegeria]